MNIGMITCNYFVRVYNYTMPEDFDWNTMSNKWRTEFKKKDFMQLATEIRDMGYEALEIWEPTFSFDVYTEEEVAELAKELRAMGFKSFAYCIGGWGKEAMPVVDKAYRFAKALGAKVVTGCIKKDAVETLLPVIEEAGKKYGLVYAIENHPSPNLESPEEVAAAMAPYETVGANLDTGIYNMQHFDVLKAMDTLKGKIYHSHFKDTNKGVNACLPIGDGDAPLEAVLKRFQKEGYDGMISVEYEYEGDPAPGLVKSIKNIKQYMK